MEFTVDTPLFFVFLVFKAFYQNKELKIVTMYCCFLRMTVAF